MRSLQISVIVREGINCDLVGGAGVALSSIYIISDNPMRVECHSSHCLLLHCNKSFITRVILSKLFKWSNFLTLCSKNNCSIEHNVKDWTNWMKYVQIRTRSEFGHFISDQYELNLDNFYLFGPRTPQPDNTCLNTWVQLNSRVFKPRLNLHRLIRGAC